MNLTVAYLTNRKRPHLDWFIDSLNRQRGDATIDVVVVDFHANNGPHTTIKYMQPKPSIWQGEHRLTKEHWFSASNSRNTALCHAKDGYIAYADDLSVLMPGWLKCVQEAMAGGYIALGAYKKVKKLEVVDGVAKWWEEFPQGIDSRWSYGSDSAAVPCNGDIMYGCSVAMPVEALLTINGWPEYCDGLGSEDYCCGIALQNAGYTFRYDRRMLTLESEEGHHTNEVFRKDDWHFENGIPVRGGNGGDDCSHAALNIAKQSRYFPQYLGDGFENMRQLRDHILNGGTFPVRKHPEHHWWTKQALAEL